MGYIIKKGSGGGGGGGDASASNQQTQINIANDLNDKLDDGLGYASVFKTGSDQSVFKTNSSSVFLDNADNSVFITDDDKSTFLDKINKSVFLSDASNDSVFKLNGRGAFISSTGSGTLTYFAEAISQTQTSMQALLNGTLVSTPSTTCTVFTGTTAAIAAAALQVFLRAANRKIISITFTSAAAAQHDIICVTA
jgi:ABC-type glycerol-3-phosphate transport system permease component